MRACQLVHFQPDTALAIIQSLLQHGAADTINCQNKVSLQFAFTTSTNMTQFTYHLQMGYDLMAWYCAGWGHGADRAGQSRF